jgi:hypothetical protein
LFSRVICGLIGVVSAHPDPFQGHVLIADGDVDIPPDHQTRCGAANLAGLTERCKHGHQVEGPRDLSSPGRQRLGPAE